MSWKRVKATERMMELIGENSVRKHGIKEGDIFYIDYELQQISKKKPRPLSSSQQKLKRELYRTKERSGMDLLAHPPSIIESYNFDTGRTTYSRVRKRKR